MLKQFINEVNRMKDLFGYKKGVVISEQSYIHEDNGMVSPIKPGSITTAINSPEVKAELGNSQYLSDESWKSKTLPDVSLHGLRKCNMSGYKEQGNMECNQIWDDHYANFYEESVWKQKYGKDVPSEIKGTRDAKGNEMIPNTDRTKTDATSTSTDYQLDTPKKIQDFQTWMDGKYPNWAYSQKYKRNYNVGGNPKLGFGILGPNTKKAWNNPKYKEEYLKTLPTTGNNSSSNTQAASSNTQAASSNTQAASSSYIIDPTWLKNNGWIVAVENGKPNYSFENDMVNNSVLVSDYEYIIYKGKMTYACQVGKVTTCYSNNGTNIVDKTEDFQSAKKNVGLDETAQSATAQPAEQPAAQKPDEIYNNLWKGGLVQGDPEGQGRIRIDVKTLNDDQKEKLKQYMPTLGYEYLRTKNRDGRFVFTKIRQQEEE